MADDITPVPEIAEAIRDVMDRKRMRRGMDLMAMRESDFRSKLEMQLTGMAYEPSSRELLNDALTSVFETSVPGLRKDSFRDGGYLSSGFRDRECIVGGGYAAAVYAAVRVRMGFPKPIVLETSPAAQVGGTFAWFNGRLNSGNRPGSFGSPRDPASSVNYLPGGILQPSMIPAGDFHYGPDIALCIRIALAQFADVVPDCMVTRLDGVSSTRDGLGGRVVLGNGTQYDFRRVLDARGLGNPRFTDESDRLMSFVTFSRKMGEAWPLKGVRRMAIAGDGKSALCAAESALGITPGVAYLDRVEQVDLYAPSLPVRYKDFRKGVRVRYLALAREIGKRLDIYNVRAEPMPSYGGVTIGGTTYDMCVMATGFERADDDPFSFFDYKGIARRADPLEVYQIGVRSQLPFSRQEIDQGLADEAENKDAMFRYGPRIAALAATLK